LACNKLEVYALESVKTVTGIKMPRASMAISKLRSRSDKLGIG